MTSPATDVAGGTLLRLAAFTADPAGGNPAGVWIGDELPPAEVMQRIAADVGYSETAFLAPGGAAGRYRVHYFSPLAEVPFCGHATIASGVALAERGAWGSLELATNDGTVELVTARDASGRWTATLTSVGARVEPASESLADAALRAFGWTPADLDPALSPALAYAGAWHLILVARRVERLAALDYPFDEVQRLMRDTDLTTIALMARLGADRWRARNAFAVGGVVEDPATGAAAAAFGAYLRDRGIIGETATFDIEQGIEMGRPSLLSIAVEAGDTRVRVAGTAVGIAEA